MIPRRAHTAATPQASKDWSNPIQNHHYCPEHTCEPRILGAGTLAYLGRVQELVTLMRDCRNILKYHSTDDSRLTTARAIVGEYRICTQYAMDVWATKDKWLKTPKVLRPKQLFMAPETLHATHCTVEAFIGKCGPRAHVAAP